VRSAIRLRVAALGVWAAGVLTVAAVSAAGGAEEPDRPSFDAWLADVRSEAVARGIREQTVAEAFQHLQPLDIVVTRDRTQAEFSLTLDQYLARRVTRDAVRTGRRFFRTHRLLLRRVEAKFGVDAATLVAIWGLESNFGRFSGVRPTIATLATLAYEPRRAAYFRQELFSALEILDRGDIGLTAMKGSWAGAMGQPQFMPSSYLEYAVDFDRDGRKDIWGSQADVFASIANYLQGHGWTRGQRWGRRVVVSARVKSDLVSKVSSRTEGCRAVRDLSESLPLTRWHQLGVRLGKRQRLPASPQAGSLLQLGEAAFLVYRNYEALLGYNCAHPYALSVALLADRIAAR
jgi:membrane-bound lytic murein transglycosylase B